MPTRLVLNNEVTHLHLVEECVELETPILSALARCVVAGERLGIALDVVAASSEERKTKVQLESNVILFQYQCLKLGRFQGAGVELRCTSATP